MKKPNCDMTKVCHWKQDEEGIYDTSCGNRFETLEGNSVSNRFKYCCYCGGVLIEQKGQEE